MHRIVLFPGISCAMSRFEFLHPGRGRFDYDPILAPLDSQVTPRTSPGARCQGFAGKHRKASSTRAPLSPKERRFQPVVLLRAYGCSTPIERFGAGTRNQAKNHYFAPTHADPHPRGSHPSQPPRPRVHLVPDRGYSTKTPTDD
jgi:hypothetical protein